MEKICICLFAVLALCSAVSAQHGGKAEPRRIEFAAGKSSTTVGGTLSNGQEAEYIFSAKKGQTVTIRNSNRSLFDFRVFSQEFDVETEFESSPTLVLDLPETGDYMFFVRKKQVKTPRTARFSLTISINERRVAVIRRANLNHIQIPRIQAVQVRSHFNQ